MHLCLTFRGAACKINKVWCTLAQNVSGSERFMITGDIAGVCAFCVLCDVVYCLTRYMIAAGDGQIRRVFH